MCDRRSADDAGLALVDHAPTTAGRDTTAAVVPALLATPMPVAVAADGTDISLYQLPGHGTALTGDGADNAARAVIAAALTTNPHDHPTFRKPMVVTTRATLTRLLPAGAAHQLAAGRQVFDHDDHLHVFADNAAAIADLEASIITRRRQLEHAIHAHNPPIDIADVNRRFDLDEPTPPYVLVLDADPAHDARLRAATADRHTLHLHPVILGASDPMTTYPIAADGTSLDPSPGPAAPARWATTTADDLAAVFHLAGETLPGPEDGTDFETDPPPAPPVPAVTAPVPGPDAAPPVQLYVLGPASLATTNAGPITSGVRSGSYALLALLAVRPNGCTLDELTDALHPDIEPANAAKRVRTDINSLRGVLRTATGRAESGGFVIHENGRYRIDPDTIGVDLWQMLTAITDANNAADDRTALQALQQAADLYRGDFATGIDRAWALDQATTHRHQHLNVLTRIAEILEADEPEQAIAVLERAIDADPVNEELYQRLIRIHGRQDHPDLARRTYALLENRLSDLGMAEPSEATRRVLHRQLQAHRRAG
ncbi:hypothetical protein GCM10010123_40330 [Pilimelia anulata]|uniref:Bacterial transcriptional activator domain-containing protein n=1 Tax=Pilimelia anulata TaxID=53371 RepID=A0A8J3FBW5_9ACTN|nr:bacterial transcriptional activator domain-containing protein [Pilimelia anulata]GGK06442.1 hypothetical protein GCM10010123_40330 [Pilimelia anulata]